MSLTSPEEFQGWRDHPLTKEFLGLLLKRQRRLMEGWGSGRTMSAEEQAQAVLLGQLGRLRFSETEQDEGPRGATITDLAELEEQDDGKEG